MVPDFDGAMDNIYEAAIVPDRWPAVLDMIAGMAGAVGTILVAEDLRDLRWLNSPSLDGLMAEFIAGDWAQHSTRTAKLVAAEHAGFVLEEDVYTPAEIESDVLISRFLRPRGLGWATATAFAMPTGDNLIFSVERRYADGPVPREAVGRLDRIRPHLGRAALLSARLHLERARVAAQALGMLGLPAGIVGRDLRLRAANDLLEEFIPRVVRDTRERLGFVDAAADAMLARVFAGGIGHVPHSIPLRATERDPAIVAHLLPVRGEARDLFSGGAFVLAMTPAQPSPVPGASLLQGLFDLTAAEARVVRGIVGGATVADLASRHGVQTETVRSQIKSALGKTGVTRQIDLVRLVSGLRLVG